MTASTKTKTPKITFEDFMTILNTLKTSTCCVKENHSFYIYRADTHQVLARGLDGYEAAKTAANHLRHSLGPPEEGQTSCTGMDMSNFWR